MDISRTNAANAVEFAESRLVLADRAETLGHLDEARLLARRAGDYYTDAAHHVSRIAVVDDGSPERTALWLEAADLLRKAAVAYRRGKSSKKVAERERLAASWERGMPGRG